MENNFNEFYLIIKNIPYYAIALQLGILLSFAWMFFIKNKSSLRNKNTFTVEEQNEKIANYEPEQLVPDTADDHPKLKTKIVLSKIDKRINVNGFDCLNLATHNYLGLLNDNDIEKEAVTSLRKYGVGSCGPRGFYGTLDVHLELEERLAKFMNMEEAIVYAYGFSTIASAIPAYSKQKDVIFADEKCNFSIQKGLDGARSTVYYYKHNDMNNLEQLLIEQQKRNQKNPGKAAKTKIFLIAEGIYMNSGEICPLPELIELRKKYKLRLFLDESISFGTLGKNGRGVTEHFNVDLTEVDLISAGLEWAAGTIGGFCVGSSFIVEHQRLSGLGYCFSASLPPLLAQAAISALDRFEKDPKIFEELAFCSKNLHHKLGKLSSMKLIGNELSPVKHLFLNKELAPADENNILSKIVEQCIENGLAVAESEYLDDIEKFHPRHSLRITCNRYLNDNDVDRAYKILEKVCASNI